MGCKQSVYVSQDVEHKKCLDHLSKEPNLREYQGNGDALKKMGVMYKNQIYGCSVLLHVGDKDSKKRTKKNPLTDEINQFNVQHLYLGGFKEIACHFSSLYFLVYLSVVEICVVEEFLLQLLEVVVPTTGHVPNYYKMWS